MNPGRLFDARGNAITLAKELGRGGEGAVYDVAGRPDAVAKVYLKPPGTQLSAKLCAMAGMASVSLLKIAAWPTATLHDSSGAIAGFTMPKVGGHKPIFQLYLPKPRLQAFPKADWRFLIHAAANTARAFATVHSAGLVIGDVNHGNLVVAKDATVQMIDCDSFQLSQAGQTWFCTVGVGTHQPPEMQGRDSYAGIVRTPNHDNFGLAVLIFQLLCMARHPFAGRFLGTGEPPSIEEAITASKYAYSRERSRTKMEAPPSSLPIGALSSELQDLFEQAFAPGVTQGGRPLADRWVSALGNLANDLRSCRTNSTHFYRNGLTTCPWCTIENASGITLFPVVFVPGAVGAGGMAALWQEVGRVPEPPALGPWPQTPPGGSSPSPESRQAAKKGQKLRVAAWASVAVALGAAFVVAPPQTRAFLIPVIGVLAFLIFQHAQKTKPGAFRKRLIDVKQDWETLRSSWIIPAHSQNFADIRNALSKHKAEYDDLPTERSKRLQRLQEQRRTKQLEDHLDQFPIASATISGIGSTRVAVLSSHGIDTAGDIVSARVLAIPKFGPTTLASLLAWRQIHERSFRFDPNRDVAQTDVAIIERDVATHKTRLEREVEAGLARLKSVSSATATRVLALNGSMAELGPRYAQAVADAAVVPEDRQTYLRLLGMSGMAIAVALISVVSTPPRPGVAQLAVSSVLADPHTPSSKPTVQPTPKVAATAPAVAASINALLEVLYADSPGSVRIPNAKACVGRACKPRSLGKDSWTSRDGVEHQIIAAVVEVKDDCHACSAILGIGQFRRSSPSDNWQKEILTPAVMHVGSYGVFSGTVTFVDGGSLGRVVELEDSGGGQGEFGSNAFLVMTVDNVFKEVLQVPLSLSVDGACDSKEAECRKRVTSANYNSKLSISVGDDRKLHLGQTFTAAIPISPASWIIDEHGVVRQTAGGKAGPGVYAQERATLQSPAFDQGRADRVTFEAWFGGLKDEVRLGAESWSSRRSLRSPGNCDPSPEQSQQWSAGCSAARQKLSAADVRRKFDPEYRRGWNSL